MGKLDLGKLYDDLDRAISRLSFLIETSTAYQEKVANGDIEIHRDCITGHYLIYSDVENQLKNILEKIKEVS